MIEAETMVNPVAVETVVAKKKRVRTEEQKAAAKHRRQLRKAKKAMDSFDKQVPQLLADAFTRQQ